MVFILLVVMFDPLGMYEEEFMQHKALLQLQGLLYS